MEIDFLGKKLFDLGILLLQTKAVNQKVKILITRNIMKKENLIKIKPGTILFALSMLFVISLTSCGENQKNNQENKIATQDQVQIERKIVSKEIDYKAGDVTLKGYLYYDENNSQKSQGIIVVHEWWGNNEYNRMRAEMLAELGYVAFAADMYGDGKVLDNPQDAQNSAGAIYSDPNLLKERMNAAYETLKNSGFADPNHVAAVGYCFGGTVALNAANAGIPLDAVVSFHGGLNGFKADSAIKKTPVLVCNGAADNFITQEDIDNFKKSMDAVGAPYEFINYEGATHAFTNPGSTEAGEKFNMPIAYNAQADSASWKDMQVFFSKYFPVK